MGNNSPYKSTGSWKLDDQILLDAQQQEKEKLMARGTPKKPDVNTTDKEWEKLFPNLKDIENKTKKGNFKKSIMNMDDASWDFWMKPDPKTGKSRYETWDFPMDENDYWKTSYGFGDGRPVKKPTRNHAGLDIFGHGGASGNDGHTIKAVTGGTVIGSSKTYYPVDTNKDGKADYYTYQVLVKNDDGSVIAYSELWDNDPKGKGKTIDWAKGTRIEQGDAMGYTKKMENDSMLHIEVYDGSKGDIAPNKTSNNNYSNVNDKKYNRRSDLVDPTLFGAL